MNNARGPRRHYLQHDATADDIARVAEALLEDPADAAIRDDPMLAWIPREEAPHSFWLFPATERSKRGRFHIITRCAGTDAIVAWHFTMYDSESNQRFINEVTDGCSDERILEMLKVDGGWFEDG